MSDTTQDVIDRLNELVDGLENGEVVLSSVEIKEGLPHESKRLDIEYWD